MATSVEIWRGDPVSVPADRILRIQGYNRSGRRVRPAVAEAADHAVRLAGERAVPEARIVRIPVEFCAGSSLVLSGGFGFSCPVFGELLGHCDEALVFVLTLGPGLEAEIAEQMARSEPLIAYFLDMAGWLLVEQASRQLRGDLSRRLVTEGRVMTARLGPGYDYRDGATRTRWDLEQQHELFRVFGDAELPVTLLESSAMMPRLSRSGLYGLAPAANASGSQSAS